MTQDKDVQDKVAQLQLLQQNLQTLLVQKQQFQLQLNEIESATSELNNTKQVYKVIGNIMVLSTQENVKKELAEKREMVEMRIKNFETQEERLKKKAEELQHAVITELKKEKE